MPANRSIAGQCIEWLRCHLKNYCENDSPLNHMRFFYYKMPNRIWNVPSTLRITWNNGCVNVHVCKIRKDWYHSNSNVFKDMKWIWTNSTEIAHKYYGFSYTFGNTRIISQMIRFAWLAGPIAVSPTNLFSLSNKLRQPYIFDFSVFRRVF